MTCQYSKVFTLQNLIPVTTLFESYRSHNPVSRSPKSPVQSNTKPTAPASPRKATRATFVTLQKLTKPAKVAATKEHRRRCEELHALSARRKPEITEAYYDVGSALRELFRKELDHTLDHTSFEKGQRL